MKLLSSFTQPQVVPNLYMSFFFSAEHKRRCFEECSKIWGKYYGSGMGNGAHQLFGYQHSPKQRNSYRL